MRWIAAVALLTLCAPLAVAAEAGQRKVAALVSMYTPDSHADLIVTRLLKTSTLDGQGRRSPLSLASLYADQVPPRDISRRLAAEHHFPIYGNVRDALTLGTGRLAVDGVLVIFEHGDYPVSPTGQAQYPKRRVFDEIVRVFDESGRVVPVFIDKHLADTWTDAKAIYDEAQRHKIPLMAGSSLPTLWRYPPLDVEVGKPLKELVAVTFHTLDAYGFHALEMAQCLAERRAGGETGVRSVRTLVDEEVWRGGETGLYDRALLDAAVKKVLWRPYAGDDLRKTVAHPVLWMIDYKDGLRVSILTLNYAVGQWAAAWRYRDADNVHATLFWTQEMRPFMHFQYQLEGIEQMVATGRPAWPVERTLLTSGMLDALLTSKAGGGRVIQTPWLGVRYQSNWTWRQPPKAPPPYLFFPK